MAYSEKTDLQLVKALRLHNSAAFEETVRRFSSRVYSLAYRLTKNPEDTEEVLQDTFVVVYRKIKNFEGKSSLSSWIYRITVNTALMKLRKRRSDRLCFLEDCVPDFRESAVLQDDSFKKIGNNLMLRREIEKAIAGLPYEFKVVLVLRDIDGLNTKEVCEILGLSPATVKSRLHRARVILRHDLKYYSTEEDLRQAA